jgi:ATP-dependent DNA ligase
MRLQRVGKRQSGSNSTQPKRAQKAKAAAGAKGAAKAWHAFVGGWSQRRGDFVSLLLGVRQGKRRKLTYIGEVKTDPDGLATILLEPLLREGEVETSPFVEQPPAHRDQAHHWIAPALVAEIAFDGWTRDGTISAPSLRAVAGRPSFRNARWVALPKK